MTNRKSAPKKSEPLANPVAASAWDWAKTLFFAISIALLIRWTCFEPFKIPSGSMEPTLHGDERFLRGDRVLVNKLAYGLRIPFTSKLVWKRATPQRWDIVVFRTVEENSRAKILIKRIVGLPGEKIHVGNDGKVYANGEALTLPPSMPPVLYTRDGKYGIEEAPQLSAVPEGCYLVLGDNSAFSRDGRYWGWLPEGHILGRAYAIGWPPAHWRDFTGFTQTLWWRTLASLTALFLIWRAFFGRSWRVHNAALENLAPGDHLYIHRCAYGLPIPFTSWRFYAGRLPKRGEIVLYRAEGHEDWLLGRVAALPGEDVYFSKGALTINGAQIEHPAFSGRDYLPGGGTFGRSKGKDVSRVPDGHCFILCDNPEAAPDGRTLGWTPRAALIGQVAVVWWPVRSLRRIQP